MPVVAELMAMSNFTFREGASHADELVITAKALGLSALAITDRNSVAGLVRGHLAARNHGLRFIPAARIDLADGFSYLCWPADRAAWGRLTTLLSLGRMRAPKGACFLTREEFLAHAEGQVLALLASPVIRPSAPPSPTLPRKGGGSPCGAAPSPLPLRERDRVRGRRGNTCPAAATPCSPPASPALSPAWSACRSPPCRSIACSARSPAMAARR